MTIREMKEKARTALSQNRKPAVLAILVPILLYIVLYAAFFGLGFLFLMQEQLSIGMLFFLMAFLVAIIFIPIYVGIARFFRKFIAGEEPAVKTIGEAYTEGRFFRNLGRILQTVIYFYLWTWLYMIIIQGIFMAVVFAGGFLPALDFEMEMMDLITAMFGLFIIWIGVIILMFVLIIRKALSYAMVPFVLSDDDFRDHHLAPVKLSNMMMKKRKGKLFVTLLSFIGWLILGTLTLLILNFLHVYPYISGTLAAFYEDAKGDLQAKLQA